MLGYFFPGSVRVIGEFVSRVSGDAVVFDARVHPNPVGMEIGPDVIVFQIEANVPVELTVLEISRVPLFGTPDLLR